MLSHSAKTARTLAKHGRTAQRVAAASKSNKAFAGDYLHESIVPTDHFQDSLPHLPVPKLEDTCRRYLTSQEALLEQDEFQKTKKIVDDFQNGVGKGMHEELLAMDKRNKGTSYVTEPWFDMYLRDRRPVVLNHNPFMSFVNDPKEKYNRQDIRATNFIVSASRFAVTLWDNILEPEVFHLEPAKSDTAQFRKFVRWLPRSISWFGAYWYKAFPLDMSQFTNLFNTSRIPRPEKDEISYNPHGRHMLIMRNGHFYTFNAFDDSGHIKRPEEILAYIQYILNDATPPPEFPLGIMTSQDRDSWSKVRQQLVDSGNSNALDKIDSALFALALDDFTSDDFVSASKNLLHGDGMNRWADKSFSIIVQKDGRSTVNFEHSWGDGVAVLRMMNEVHKCSTESPGCHPDTVPASVDPTREVERLEFNMTDETKAAIVEAKQKFSAATGSLDINYSQLHGQGKDFIKSNKLGPDSFMQLAIQMAYWRLNRERAATYESCSTSAFKKGRTETVRPLTMATRHACQLFDKPDAASPDELYAALSECTTVHNQLTKEAAMGQGWDRHFFAMKYYAEQSGNVPDIFKDPNYLKINRVILSTSTVSSSALEMGGFGPVIPDGYGVGYACQPDFSGFLVTSYKPHRSVSDFLGSMDSVYKDLTTVLEKRKK